jgi:hypothetical protein
MHNYGGDNIGQSKIFVKHYGLVWQWTGLNPTQNPKKLFSKLIKTFLLFISYQSLYITIQIKKSLQNKKFQFFYTKHSYFFLHINQICYNTDPLSQVQSITKHSLQYSNHRRIRQTSTTLLPK